MRAVISYRKFLSLVTSLGLALVLASTASAGAPPPIQLDLRNGATDIVAVTTGTDVVDSEFWFVVNGADADLTNDRLANMTVAAYSSPGPAGGPGGSDSGIIKGTITVDWSAAWNASGVILPSKGLSADLDADGDLDRGSTINTTSTGWMYGAWVADPGEGTELPQSPFDVANIKFTGTGFVPGAHGVTKLFMWGSTDPVGTNWMRDGTAGNGQAAPGRIVTLYRPATAVVGPTLTLGVATPTGNLGGTGSTGTIGTWQWLIDGIPTALTGDNPNVSWDYLVNTLSLAPGATYGVTLNLGSAYETGITPGTGFITLELTPEPATLTLLAFGALAMLARRRRSA